MTQERSDLVREVVSMDSYSFLDFSRRMLKVSVDTIKDEEDRGDIDEEMKYDHVQESFKRDPEGVRGRLPKTLSHVVQQSAPLADQLPSDAVYRIIDFQKTTGNSWLSFARETLGVNVDRITIALANRVISEQQKRTLLENWIQEEGDASSEKLQELEIGYKDFTAWRAF